MTEEKLETNHTREDFKEWVRGGLELTKPWKTALIVTNICWAVVLGLFIFFAYMTPMEIEQSQDIPTESQSQTVKGAN